MTAASVGHQCPECVAEGRRTQRPARTALGGGAAGQHGYVTKGLLGLNVLVFLLSVISAGRFDAVAGGTGLGGLAGTGTPLTRWGAVLGAALYPDDSLHGIAFGEYYRLFTAMFLHYGVIHLAMNMWALWMLGRQLEADLGPLRFAGLYLLAGLGGNVAVYLFSNPAATTVGASTSVFGLFAALFVIFRRLRRDTSAIVPILVINLIFTLTVRGISISGHFGGLIVGAMIGAILAYAPPKHRNLVQGVGLGGMLLVLVLLTVARTASLTG
jgi:membrane associated rhomboid family serine protease